MRIRTRSFLPAAIWFAYITVLFLLPGSDLPDEDWFHKVYLDKWVHSGFFFLQVYLTELPFIARKVKNSSTWFRYILVCTVVYGILIEFIQKFWIPGRSFDVMDMIFDSIGAIAAYFLGIKLAGKHLKR